MKRVILPSKRPTWWEIVHTEQGYKLFVALRTKRITRRSRSLARTYHLSTTNRKGEM